MEDDADPKIISLSLVCKDENTYQKVPMCIFVSANSLSSLCLFQTSITRIFYTILSEC